MPTMGTIVDVTDAEWEQVADLFDPDGRRGAPEVYPRRRSQWRRWAARARLARTIRMDKDRQTTTLSPGFDAVVDGLG